MVFGMVWGFLFVFPLQFCFGCKTEILTLCLWSVFLLLFDLTTRWQYRPVIQILFCRHIGGLLDAKLLWYCFYLISNQLCQLFYSFIRSIFYHS